MDSPNRYFGFTQKMLSIGGLWYTQPYKERLIRYYIISFISIYSIFGELCQILTMNLDLLSIVRSLQVCIPAICVTFLYYSCALHFRGLQTMYNYIQYERQRLKNDIEFLVMRKYHFYCNLFTIISIIIFYLYMTISILPPLIRIFLSSNEKRSDIDHYPIISCIDYVLDRRTYYYPLVMYQIVASVLFGSLCMSCYTMYFSFVIHVCADLAIIRFKLSSPFISSDNNDNVLETPLDYTNWIIDIVQHLTRTKEFLAILNATSEKCWLLQVILAFIVIIMNFLCLFQIPVLLEEKENATNVLELIVFIVSTLLLLFINCYIGQTLIDYSMDVYNEVCMIPIHEISLKTQKILLTTIMVSSKPCVISIGKVYVASHELFSNILQTALSFAMVVHSMQDM